MSYNPYAYGASDPNTPNGNNGVQDRFQTHPNIQPAQQQQQMPQQGYMNQGQPPQGFMNQPQGAQQAGQGAQPAFLDSGASMAFQIGSNAFNSFMGNSNFNQFQDTMSKAAGTSSNLSHYFQVSTSFVIWKLKQLLFPYLKTVNNWQRIVLDSSNAQGGASTANGTSMYATPREDVNSPDMYIPVMGLITYILVWNIKQGLNGTFNPENLYYKLSSTLAFVGLDLFILKLGLYLLVSSPNLANTSVTSLIELTCFVGYKFVPLTLTLFAPSTPLWVNIALKTYLFITFGIFLLRSIKFNLFNTQESMMINSIKKSTVKKCNYFLFVYGFLWQFVLMWLMA